MQTWIYMLLIGFGNTFSCCLDYVKFSSRESGSHTEENCCCVSQNNICSSSRPSPWSYGLISDTWLDPFHIRPKKRKKSMNRLQWEMVQSAFIPGSNGSAVVLSTYWIFVGCDQLWWKHETRVGQAICPPIIHRHRMMFGKKLKWREGANF